MYEVNEIGLQRAKYVKKESKKIFFIGIPYFIALLFFLNCTMSKRIIFFYSFILPFTALLIIFFFIITLNWIRKHNVTVKMINFENCNIRFVTFAMLGLKSKVFLLSESEIIIKKSNFGWYGKGEKEEASIAMPGNRSLYLVKDYFDDYDEIIKTLSNLHISYV